MTEDWPVLLSFFPDDWIELASSTSALSGPFNRENNRIRFFYFPLGI